MSKISQGNLNEPVIDFASKDYTHLQAGQTVGQALESLRNTQLAQKIIYFYVVDDDEKLIGVVPTRRLLMSPPSAHLNDIMVTNVISIDGSMSVLDACEHFVMHRLLALPVVDAAGHMQGVVDVSLFTDEMFNVSEKESAQDVFQLLGIQIARGRRGSPVYGFINRFPWLLCNIGGGIACAFIAEAHDTFLHSWIVLAAFIPVVLNLAEAVSMQSMTLTLQEFHSGRTDWMMLLRSLRLELATAVLMGSAAGLVVGAVEWIWKHQAMVAVAIGCSICAAIVTACLLGVLLPTLVRLLRGDPKIAAGPVVLACADIATLLFYFNLSTKFLS